MDELGRLDGVGLGKLVRRGDVSASELLDLCARDIELFNPITGAFVSTTIDSARASALRGLPEGTLSGIPIALKDLRIETAGDVTYQGCAALRTDGMRAVQDDGVSARLRAGGLLFIGRTATAEFGMGVTTESNAFGPTRNPWDLTRSAGGSSGGSAAAVSAGLVPIAVGCDMGGSIRIPAAACGVVGLKPSRGRVSPGPNRTEGLAAWWVTGPICRSVRDVAAMLDEMSGYSIGDISVAPVPRRRYIDEVGTDPGQLHIGIATAAFNLAVQVDDDCSAAVEKAAHVLETLGHLVEYKYPKALLEYDRFMDYVNVCAPVGLAADIAYAERGIGRKIVDAELEPSTQYLREMARRTSGLEIALSLENLAKYTRRIQQWWEDGNDVLITPTTPTPAPTLGFYREPVIGIKRTIDTLHFTCYVNSTGQPAISLPTHSTRDGYPVGIQLVAAYGREDILIQVASQLESAMPWSGRFPPTHGTNLSMEFARLGGDQNVHKCA